MTNRTKRSLATIGLAVLLLPTCASSCFIVNLVNPIAISFISTTRIANETNESLTVTPLWNYCDEWKSIHSVMTGWLALPSFHCPIYRLNPGQAVSIHIGDDRARLDAIAITTTDGRRVLYELFSNRDPITNRWNSENAPRTARIITLDSLPPLPTEISTAIDQSFAGFGVDGIVFYAFLSTPFFFICCYRIRRRNSASAQ